MLDNSHCTAIRMS